MLECGYGIHRLVSSIAFSIHEINDSVCTSLQEMSRSQVTGQECLIDNPNAYAVEAYLNLTSGTL